MLIFHIATASDWARARRSGSYTTSTYGRTLAEEGFLHAARREQVPGVFERYYRDIEEPLVLLTIDTDRLAVPWRVDPVGSDSFPHVYGALSPRAVTHVQRLNRSGGTESFTTLFAQEMGLRIGLAVLAMALAFLGARLGRELPTDWGEFGGAAAGLLMGVALVTMVLQRRRGAPLTPRR